jgi:hypothetical protein
MTNLTGVTGTMRCTDAGTCARRGPGHAMHIIQAQAAAATGSKWVDGIVRGANRGGWICIDPIGADGTIWAWHHADLTETLTVGAPVAIHPVYKVLAAGDIRLSIITL